MIQIVMLIASCGMLLGSPPPSESPPGLGDVIPRIPIYYFTGRKRHFHTGHLYPKDVYCIQKRMKAALIYGSPSPAQLQIMESIESIPVEERIRSIEILRGGPQRTLRRMIPQQVTTEYLAYLVSLMFMDMRVYGVLIQFVSRPGRGFQRATDIIQHVKQSFPNGNFDYLTPDRIMEWYRAIGNEKMPVFILDDPYERTRILDRNFTGPLLLQLSLAAWRDHILLPRLERLTYSGYEF